MHNIKNIRENFNLFRKNLLKRNIQINFEEILSLDENNRKLIQKKETLEKEKKDISKSQDKSLFEKSKSISIEIDEITKKHFTIKKKLFD